MVSGYVMHNDFSLALSMIMIVLIFRFVLFHVDWCQFTFIFYSVNIPEIYVQAAVYVEVLIVYFSLGTYAIAFAFASLALSSAGKNKKKRKEKNYEKTINKHNLRIYSKYYRSK